MNYFLLQDYAQNKNLFSGFIEIVVWQNGPQHCYSPFVLLSRFNKSSILGYLHQKTMIISFITGQQTRNPFHVGIVEV